MTSLGKLGIATTAALVMSFCVIASAQSSEDGGPCGHDDPSFFCLKKAEVKSLEPNLAGRFGRAWQYQYQILEQPALTVITLNGSSQIVGNPEKYLNQHTLLFQLSELFPLTYTSSSNIAAVVAAIYASHPESKGKTVRLEPSLCPGRKNNGIECLASGGRFFERFLSGVSGNLAWSERNEVQQGILTSLPTALHYGPAGEIDFDPASLFITGSNWKTALGALKDIDVERSQFFGPDETECFIKKENDAHRKDCVRKFARPRFAASRNQGVRTGIGEGLIPKFQFKVADQFDFIKNGGVLVPQAGLQRSLKNYSFIWDLKRLIPSTSDRLAALTAYRSYPAKPADKETVTQTKVCVTDSAAARGYMPVGDDFTVSRCRLLAKDVGAASFALACATSTGMEIGVPNDADTNRPVLMPKANACNWEARPEF